MTRHEVDSDYEDNDNSDIFVKWQHPTRNNAIHLTTNKRQKTDDFMYSRRRVRRWLSSGTLRREAR
jgi:hypothetical protein